MTPSRTPERKKTNTNNNSINLTNILCIDDEQTEWRSEFIVIYVWYRMQRAIALDPQIEIHFE